MYDKKEKQELCPGTQESRQATQASRVKNRLKA